MLRSLYAGISGLKNHQIRMDTTGNNISNVNTTGYKYGQANFQDALSQTIQSGGDGKNPAQVGVGTTLAGIATDFSNGGLLDTGRNLDLAIQGNGFFVLKDPDTETEYYSRDGKFFFDDEGFLVNSNGFRVQSKDGDIKVFNGPVDSINIATDGTITGTNNEGMPLQLSSNPVTIPEPTPPQEAKLTGETLSNSLINLEEAQINGAAISVVEAQLEEARLQGNSSSPEAAPLGINSEPFDMSGYELTLTYNDGADSTVITLNTNLTEVTSWNDLASQLQEALDKSSIAGKVTVRYDSGNHGGLVFETVTNPDETNSSNDFITPSITLGGTGVEKYMGDVGTLTDSGSAVQSKDWTGKQFFIDTGAGWQEINLVDNFNGYTTGLDKVTSGEYLAKKLNNLLNIMAGGTVLTDLRSPENMTASVGNTGSGNLTITGTYNGTSNETLTVQKTSSGWSIDGGTTDILTDASGDTTFEYNGMVIDVSGVSGVTDGDSWSYNLTVDSQTTNVEVLWDTDHLVFKTRGTPADGSTIPTMKIEGDDAVDFIGSSSKSDTGINSADWSNKDININYNGTIYNFSTSEKTTAGLNNITSGSTLANALQTLIDNKIGSDKVQVTWDSGKLSFATINTSGEDIQPTILIGGADAADFVGENPVIVEGVASIQPAPEADIRQIKLVAFNNPEGLKRAGNNLFTESESTQEKSEDNTSLIQSGFLEGSNVDLTTEFSNMITTQRGYQANSRVVTVSDTMLDELMRLKR